MCTCMSQLHKLVNKFCWIWSRGLGEDSIGDRRTDGGVRIIRPLHDKTSKINCASNEDSD